MVQEIITYTIIALAVAFTFKKTRKKFSKNKSLPANDNLKKETSDIQHKCSVCVSECVLRDTVSPSSDDNRSLCKKVNISSD